MAPAAALMDELVEEFLLRIPPNDPGSLLYAALVCKRWGRIVSDPGFRRRFAEFHRTPQMLGVLCNHGGKSSFVSTTSFCPSSAEILCETVDARHGYVLLHGAIWNFERKLWQEYFKFWDPIAGDERPELPLGPLSRYQQSHSILPSRAWNAAELCASAACDHLDCHGAPFLVVFVASGKRFGMSGMCAFAYSSEAAEWIQLIHAPNLVDDVKLVPSALAGNLLYFLCSKSVLKFDVATREMSLIDLPPPQQTFWFPILRATADGGLGLGRICYDGMELPYLQLWSREIGPDEDLVWAQSKVINLYELLHAVIPDGRFGSPWLTSSALGLDVILVIILVGIFTLHLKSLRLTKVCKDSWRDAFAFPYISFYTPGLTAALGAAASAE